jgi:hypothetical protein
MKTLGLALVLASSLCLPVIARAQSDTPPAASAEEAKALVKAASSIENRLPVGEATSFKAGETIYVWSEVTGAAGQEVEHVWKRDGKEVRRAKLSIGAKKWKTNSRMQKVGKGSYVVEVVLGEQKIGEVSFTVE